MDWARVGLNKLQIWFNVFVKLMLFHNIKRSLKVIHTTCNIARCATVQLYVTIHFTEYEYQSQLPLYNVSGFFFLKGEGWG